MRHVNYLLKPATIDNAKPREKAYPLTDGGGLFVEVLPSGSKVWRFKYHLAGKREKVTLGQYPAVTIKAARDRHEELRALVEAGESPARGKKVSAVEEKREQARAVTFEAFARTWLAEAMKGRAPTYRDQVKFWLERDVFPAFGAKALGDVEPEDVLDVVQPLAGTPTTADRVRVVVQQIYDFAILRLLVKANPARPLRGTIIVPPKTHHRHLVGKEIGAFWRCLAKQGAHATTVAAAQLLLLTMTRKNELLRARWDEFDLEAAAWTIPADRMKARRPHRVYLSRQALALLRGVHALTAPREGDPPVDGGAYVFPSIFRRSVPMGDVTLNHFFKRMDFGVDDFSPHGTRGTAATLLREKGVRKDVVELLLAHTERDATAASYSHHELAEERAAALQLLADEVDRLAAGAEIIPIRAA